MANEITEQKPATFSEALMVTLNEHNEALPKDFNKSRFVQNAIALINDNPNLQKYNQSQLKAGLLKGAFLGLDFYNKEAYLIPYGNQLNFQIDYRGSKKLAKKYSIRAIKDIYAEIVRKGDEFEKEIDGENTKVKFKPVPFSDEQVLGAFAVVIYKDGGCQCEVMSLKELETTRSKSKASNSMAWKDFTTEMYRKTVLHRLCKHIEIDFENPTQSDLWQESNTTDINTEPVAVDNPFDESTGEIIEGTAKEVE